MDCCRFTLPTRAAMRSTSTTVLSSWLWRFPCLCEAAVTSPRLLLLAPPGDTTVNPCRLRSRMWSLERAEECPSPEALALVNAPPLPAWDRGYMCVRISAHERRVYGGRDVYGLKKNVMIRYLERRCDVARYCCCVLRISRSEVEKGAVRFFH